jgi:hypothetical protein
MTNGIRANAVWIQALSVAATSKQQQLAWKFIRDIVLNPESDFQADWSKHDVPTSRPGIHRLKLGDDPGWKVCLDEFNHVVKSVVYRNPKLKMFLTATRLGRLASLNSDAEVQRVLSQYASDIDHRLDDTKWF